MDASHPVRAEDELSTVPTAFGETWTVGVRHRG